MLTEFIAADLNVGIGDTADDMMRAKNRDNVRTPFQWDDSANAGFTNGILYL